MTMNASIRYVMLAGALSGIWTACASTTVQPSSQTDKLGLPTPPVVMVYSFAVNPTEVIENDSLIHHMIVSQDPTPADQRLREIGQEANEALVETLITGISELGIATKRGYKDMPVPPHAVTIHGAFLDIDQGNRARRVMIGFGAGASRIDAKVFMFQESPGLTAKLLEFKTHADSGKMPGAAVTMGAGAAAQGAVTGGMVAANVAVSGVKVYRSEHEQMAQRSAEQAVAYISQFFAREGWIIPAKAKKVSYDDK